MAGLPLVSKALSVEGCISLFPKTADAIAQLSASAKEHALAALERIYVAPADSFPLVARATDLAEAELSTAMSILSVGKNVFVEKEMRDAASKAMVDLQSFSIDNFGTNRKLYAAFEGLQRSTATIAALSTEQKYWFDEALVEFRRQGMHLDEATFKKVAELQKRLAELSTQFSTNVAEDKTTLEFTEEQLRGVDPEMIAKLPKSTTDPSRVVCGLDYPTYFGIMRNCEVAATRFAMSNAFDSRAFPANMKVLDEVVRLRHEMSTLLGYQSYAHYDLDTKMAKTPEAAQKFVDDLIPGLQAKWAKEKALLMANLHPSVVPTESGDLIQSDIMFCINEYKKKHLNVDERAIANYFPLDATVAALFHIYESFFDIKFERIEGTSTQLWHDSVSVLAVRQGKEAGSAGPLLGHIVLDLFPRDGKFTHACCHSVVPSVEQADGTFSPSLSVVLANFPTATADKPALFMHDDAETFFHEFGHAIHGVMGRSKMATHAGTRVKRDFVELPSQMLEEWLWEKEMLQLVTKHYQTNEPLPQALIDSKIASKNAFAGRDSLRQLQFATYSLSIFSKAFAESTPLPPAAGEEKGLLDTTTLLQGMLPKVMSGIAYNPQSRFQCSFGHLMGYGAAYYGYMWSEVFAQDVFQYIKDRNGLLSPVLGRRYVQYIIGVGGGRDPNDMLRDFLERPPNGDAFVAKLGISAAAAAAASP